MTVKKEGKSYNSEQDFELAARTSELNGQRIQIRILKEKFNSGEISESAYLKKLSEANKKIEQLENKIAEMNSRLKTGRKPATSAPAGHSVQSAPASTDPQETKKQKMAATGSPSYHTRQKASSEKLKKPKYKYKQEKNRPMYKERINPLVIIIPVVIVLIAGGILGWLFLQPAGSKAGIDIGNRAPDFNGQTTGGKTVSLNDYKGRNVLLTFWGASTNCTAEWTVLETIAKANAGTNTFPVVIVPANSAALNNCLKSITTSYPILLDRDGATASRYKAAEYPTTFFIDAAGIIKHIRFGSLYSGDSIDAVFSAENNAAAGAGLRISDVSVLSISGTGAVITWATDVPSDSQVEYRYGKNTQSVTDKAMDTRHSIVLGRLQPGTEYQVSIKSRSADGTSSTLAALSFRTSPDTTPPVISEAGTANIAQTSINISWNTDEPSTSQIEYGITNGFGFLTPADNMMVTAHAMTISGLTPGTNYYIRIKSRDASGNTGIYDLKPISTKALLLNELKTGMKAPDFSLKTLDGRMVSLSDYKGKKVMLVFFSIDCRPCTIEIPMIQESAKTIRDWGVNVILITADKKTEDVKSFIDKNKITFTVLMDAELKANETYLVPLTPYNVLIDSKGIISQLQEGRYNNHDDLMTAIENIP